MKLIESIKRGWNQFCEYFDLIDNDKYGTNPYQISSTHFIPTCPECRAVLIMNDVYVNQQFLRTDSYCPECGWDFNYMESSLRDRN